MDRVLTCNGSITLVPLVAPRNGDEGHEGTMLHWMIADRLICEFGATPPEGGLPPPDVPNGYRLPAFSLWIVDWAIRHVQETIPADWSLMVEVAVAYEYDGWNSSGHIDVMGISPDGTESRGIDWKTGRDPVDAAECNEQVLTYICLKKRAWPTLRSCSFQIAQPRADEDSGFERVSTVVLEGERLEVACATLDTRVRAAIANSDELNSGRKQCRWCPVKSQCPAVLADRELMKMKLTKDAVAAIKRQPDDAMLGDWVITMRTLKAAGEDAETLLHERLDAAGSVVAGSGTIITRKIQRGSYSVPDPKKFFAAFQTILPSEESLIAAYDPSMTRAKDEIARVMDVPKTGKAAVTAESVFDAHLRPHVEQGERRILVFT